MPTLVSLANDFTVTERPLGNVFEGQTVVLAQAVAATRMYAGYGLLAAHIDVVPPLPSVTGATDITVGEWSVIRPLFMLYLERESALYWEASRGMGADPVGRSSGEVSGDIAQYEQELPHRAFSQPIVTV